MPAEALLPNLKNATCSHNGLQAFGQREDRTPIRRIEAARHAWLNPRQTIGNDAWVLEAFNRRG
jgi:hypothetical protein